MYDTVGWYGVTCHADMVDISFGVAGRRVGGLDRLMYCALPTTQGLL